MPAPAENALEIADQSHSGNLLLNQEINAVCRWTKRCGPTCILAQTNVNASRSRSSDEALMIAKEIISGESAGLVRHYCMAGKEPFETPDLLFSIAKAWHSSSANNRCGTIGAITAYPAGIASLAPRLAEKAPLSWLLASLDADTTGLRRVSNNQPLLAALIDAREIGAISAFGINTLLTGQNRDAVLEIGRTVAKAGANQWSIGPLMMPVSGIMSPATDMVTVQRLIEILATKPEFQDGPTKVTVDMDYDSLITIVGESARLNGDLGTWRFQYPISNYLSLIALNPTPFRFLRVRSDGEMLTLRDFLTVGLRHGTHGRYAPGRAAQVLREMSEQLGLQPGLTRSSAHES